MIRSSSLLTTALWRRTVSASVSRRLVLAAQQQQQSRQQQPNTLLMRSLGTTTTDNNSNSTDTTIGACRSHLEVSAEDFAAGCLLLQQAALGHLPGLQAQITQFHVQHKKPPQTLVNFRDYDRRTALHVAAAEGHLHICQYLVDTCNAQINRSDRWGASPLDDAHRHGHLHVLRFLQQRGGLSGSSSTTTNLITAAAQGDLEEVQALLEFVTTPAALDQGDYGRRRAIHLAALEGHYHVIQVLCEAGCNVNVEDRWGKRPLDDAQQYDKSVGSTKQSQECIELLKSYGAEPSESMLLVESSQNIATAASTDDMITSLISAAARGDLDYVQQFLNAESNNQEELLELMNQVAAGEGHHDVVKLLCEAGVDVNATDRWGNRPLDDALQFSSSHQEGQALSTQNDNDKTANDKPKKQLRPAACIEILEQYGAKPGNTSQSVQVEQEALLDLLHKYAKIRNGAPTLDWHDVKDLLTGIGQEPTDEVVQKLMTVADTDSDGIITEEEFMQHSEVFLGGRPARIILVVGGPGSGKGLLCERLVKECGVVHLSSGELLRAEVAKGTVLGQQVKEIMDSGGLVSSAMMVTLMNNRMKDHPGKRILLDGFPRSEENAQDLVTLCGKPELALHLDCNDTILLERIMKRGSTAAEKRADDNFHTALQRIRTFHKYHHLTMDFLREQHVPIVELDCSVAPDQVWEQLGAIGRLMRPAVRQRSLPANIMGNVHPTSHTTTTNNNINGSVNGSLNGAHTTVLPTSINERA